jgi:hypothetical protein
VYPTAVANQKDEEISGNTRREFCKLNRELGKKEFGEGEGKTDGLL